MVPKIFELILKYILTYGIGAVDLPNNKQVYSMPSALVSFKIALLSPIVYGSYLTFTEISTPFAESAIGAATCGTSYLKSDKPGV